MPWPLNEATLYTERYQKRTVYLAVWGLRNAVIILPCLLYCIATTIHVQYIYTTPIIRAQFIQYFLLTTAYIRCTTATLTHTNNNANIMYRSNVTLLPAVRSSTAELSNGAGLAPAEQGGNGVVRSEGNLCQGSPLVNITDHDSLHCPTRDLVNV